MGGVALLAQVQELVDQLDRQVVDAVERQVLQRGHGRGLAAARQTRHEDDPLGARRFTGPFAPSGPPGAHGRAPWSRAPARPGARPRSRRRCGCRWSRAATSIDVAMLPPGAPAGRRQARDLDPDQLLVVPLEPHPLVGWRPPASSSSRTPDRCRSTRAPRLRPEEVRDVDEPEARGSPCSGGSAPGARPRRAPPGSAGRARPRRRPPGDGPGAPARGRTRSCRPRSAEQQETTPTPPTSTSAP